jgi:hypothetical protein
LVHMWAGLVGPGEQPHGFHNGVSRLARDAASQCGHVSMGCNKPAPVYHGSEAGTLQVVVV